MKNYLLGFVFLCCSHVGLYAQNVPHDGVLDSTFGYNGVYIDSVPFQSNLNFTIGYSPISMILPNDSIVVMGAMNQALGLMKFTKNGFPDHAFCVNGNDSFTNHALYQAQPGGIQFQSDGKIIFFNANVISRFLPNGLPDSTFNDTGSVVTAINGTNSTNFSVATFVDMAIQQDGKYVVCGLDSTHTIDISRYNTDGSPDTGFCSCGGGRVMIHSGHIANMGKMAIQADGKIIITGTKDITTLLDTSRNFVLRCNANGTLDMSFGDSGFVFNDLSANRFVTIKYTSVLPSGKILLGGNTLLIGNNTINNGAILMARLNTDGTLDSSFGTNGATLTVPDSLASLFAAAAIQKDGKILVASQVRPSIIRLTPDGLVDSSFGSNGIINIDVTRSIANMALQSDGDIVVAGGYENEPDDAQMYLMRYTAHHNNTGVTTVSAAQSHILVYPNPSTGVYNIAAQNIAGNATLVVCDITGRTLDTKQHDFGVSSVTTVNLSGYATGMYFVKVTTVDGNTQIVKLLKE